MPPIEFYPVSQVDFEAFTAAFNRAYADYYTPIIMTAGSFRTLIRYDDVDLDASVAAIEGEQIVGTGLLGLRNRAAWIGGMGVVPERRRQGIGRRMMHYLLSQARRRAATEVWLEVIEQNQGALHLYRQLGFETVRRLLVLQRRPQSLAHPDSSYTIRTWPAAELLRYFALFHDHPNCWQRDVRSLQHRASLLRGWAALYGEDLVGYALGWSHHTEIRLADLATHPAFDRAAIAQAILAHLHRLQPEALGLSYNVAEDDPALPGYLAMGYEVIQAQLEMRLAL
jgi:ribosomal protein S18 acetylase RimI-like enzyme